MANQPGGVQSPTVVYSSFLSNGQPEPPRAEVVAWLLQQGVHTVVCGHQPHGDAPVIMRCRADDAPGELVVLTADTSFSGSVEWVATASAPLAAQSTPPAGHQLAEAPAAVATTAGAAAGAAGVPGSEKPRGAPPRGAAYRVIQYGYPGTYSTQ